MQWFSAERGAADEAAREMRDTGYFGHVGHNGEAIMTRTDPATGQALGVGTPGHDGRGTPDDRSGR